MIWSVAAAAMLVKRSETRSRCHQPPNKQMEPTCAACSRVFEHAAHLPRWAVTNSRHLGA